MREEPKAKPMSRFPDKLRIVTAIVATSVLAAVLPSEATAQAAADSAALRKRVESYENTWNTHDPSAVAAFFTEDADFVMGNRPAVHGRQAIQEWWGTYFSHQEPERRLTLEVKSARFVTDDVAVIIVATTTGGRDRHGQELAPRRFRGAWVLQRRNGDWQISAMRGFPTEEDRVVLNASLGATEALRPQIRAFVDAYEDAFNSHDPSAVSVLFRNDADIIVRNGPVTHGQAAIQDWWRAYFSEPRPYRALLIVDEIRMMNPDVALVNVFGTGAAGQAESQPSPVRYTRATWVLVREHDEWLIAALWVLPSEEDRVIRESDR